MAIEVRNLVRHFGGFTALNDVSLEIQPGELVALLGPSGSGKTTLLRIIAGLEFPSSGQILMDRIDASTRHVGARNIGFVFQHYALFRHMTVLENVAFGLRVKPRRLRPGEAEIQERVTRLLELVQLESMARRYPSQLSGGQRQRVALARALAIEPKVLLLDEPFGALDAKVRKELRRWLRHLHDEMHITSVFVTHDQEEALEVADRVVVMSQGRIEQVGTPSEVYDHPATSFVYDFLGNVNRIDCEVEGGIARLPGSRQPFATTKRADGAAVAFVRPHEIEVGHVNGHDSSTIGAPTIGKVRLIHTIGPSARMELDLNGIALEAVMDRERLRDLGLSVGDRCAINLPRVRIFEQGTR